MSRVVGARLRAFARAVVVVGLVVFPGAVGAWVTVGNGIEYQSFTASGPNNVFVCRMSRTNPNATLESTMAYGKLSGGRQVPSAQGALIDDAISWWGQQWGARNDVVCQINGDYESAIPNPSEGQVHSGWYAKRIPDWGWSGFGWTVDRLPFVGACVHTTSNRNYITVLPEGTQISFDDVNATRSTNNTILYTPQYDSTTLTDNTGVEWVVQMDRPTLILPAPDRAEGTVTQIRLNQGSTPIPWDSIVISATGSDATLLQSYLSVGKRIGITQYFLEYESDCNTPKTNHWTKTFSSIGGNVTFLKSGVIIHNMQEGMIARNPRTCICYNAEYVYYVVCDGRSASSVGWTNDEMAAFCLNTLGATDGINEDGGGSSVMVVNGKIMNSPSDGSERAVVNGTAMVNVAPEAQRTTFTAGQTVTVNTNSTAVRLGPGTNYASIATKNKNATGMVLGDPFDGVYAKGFFWWKVDFGSGVVGWVAETLLLSGGTGPTIVQHPQSQTTCAGNSAKFQVVAAGQASLSYRWQKNSVNLSNGGHYSGVLTPKLIISTIDSGDYASYRCTVTDGVGSVNSNSATLSQGSQPAAPTAQPSIDVGTDTITWNWSSVPDAQYYKLWTASSGGTQIGGVIYSNFYTETALDPAKSYTRYVESWGCGSSAARTQLGPTVTTARYCPENADWEGGFSSGIGNHWIKMSDDGTSVFAQETSIKHGGTSSQKIGDPAGGQAYTGWLYQKINVQPSRQYVLRYYSYRAGAGQSNGFVTGMGCDVNGGTSLTSIGETSAPLGQWVRRQSSPFTSGAAGVITIGVRGGQNGGDTVGYVDDMALAPAPPTSSGGAATICKGQSTTITASGGFGGSSSELHWYTGPSGAGTHAGAGTALSVSPTATTTYYPRWEAASSCSGCCDSEDGPSVTVTVNPPPSAVAVTDEGNYTPLQDTLRASWTPSTSACGIDRYEYAVGTSPGAQNIRGWTPNGSSTSATISGLSLVDGMTYYVQARAVDDYGNASDGSAANGIMVAPGVARIADAWLKANFTDPLSLRSKIVTYSSPSEFYLGESDGTSGVKVVSTANPGRGNLASVAGVLGLSGPQRVLNGDVVATVTDSKTAPIVAITERYLGGASYNGSTPGVSNGIGLYNIGLLVRIFGEVDFSDNTTDANDKYCYIDDGSGLTSGGHRGVRVRCGSTSAPTGGYAAVTGVVASESMGGVAVPVLIIRDGSDINTF